MKGRIISYVKYPRFIFISTFCGLSYISYQGFISLSKKFSRESICKCGTIKPSATFEVKFFEYLPLRTVSRIWGILSSIDLPIFLRKPLIGLYSSLFSCDLNEAQIRDLRYYKNLSEFFCREIRKDLRPIATGDVIVSPCDGTIINFGKIRNVKIEQIKGVSYSLPMFFGPLKCNDECICDKNLDNLKKCLLKNENNDLYHCVLYLSPGDYHRFHSPANWEIYFRRHFSGLLLSVNPKFIGWIQELFALNERVLYIGHWKHGFFSLTAIGATNVGSIRTYFDHDLKTNRFLKKKLFIDKTFEPISILKGEPFGEFRLGSSIVIIFEAPKDFVFCVKQGQKIKYGQILSSFLPIKIHET